jgi:hypothetical protein
MSALLLLVLALLAGAWLLRSARRAAARDRGAQGARAAALEVHRSVPGALRGFSFSASLCSALVG